MGVCAQEEKMSAIYEFDYAILNAVQGIRCPFLDAVLTFITHLCDAGWLWIVLAAIFLCFKRTRKMGAVIGVALVIGLLTVNLGLKPRVGRVRPFENELYAALIAVREPLVSVHDASFPSGHSLAAFEGAFGVFLFDVFAFVETLTSATQSDSDFGQASFVDEYSQSHDSESHILSCTGEFVEFASL